MKQNQVELISENGYIATLTLIITEENYLYNTIFKVEFDKFPQTLRF